MKNLFKSILVVMLAMTSVFFSSCSDDDDNLIPIIEAIISTPEMPEGVAFSTVNSVEYKIQDINTGIEIVEKFAKMPDTLSLEPGLYNIAVTAKATQTVAKSTSQEVNLVALLQNVEVVENKPLALDFDFFIYTPSTRGFIIEEVFFTGTQTAEGKQYSGDKYIKITNNSNDTLYADRLAISQTELLTVNSDNYYILGVSTNTNEEGEVEAQYDSIQSMDDFMKNKTAVDGLLMVPGNGTDVPVFPGESIIIADVAQNHKVEGHPGSIDLTIANFEWYNETEQGFDTDNPDVPNLDIFYQSSATVYGFHNRGLKGFILSRVPQDVTPEIFTKRGEALLDENGEPLLDKSNGKDPLFVDSEYYTNYAYLFSFTYPNGNIFEREMMFKTYAIPNEWIVDGINSSSFDDFQRLVLDPSIDMGWTGAAENNSDASRYGKSIRRKMTLDEWSNDIYQDSNNSTEDFIRRATPSLMEGNN